MSDYLKERLRAQFDDSLSRDALDRIEQLEAELAQHRDATNQCRLAFAGYVSFQSAVNKLDALPAAQELDDE